jgi:hypothetical protein
MAAVLYAKYADAKRRLWRSVVEGARGSTNLLKFQTKL